MTTHRPAATEHAHEWERGVHMAEAFGVGEGLREAGPWTDAELLRIAYANAVADFGETNRSLWSIVANEYDRLRGDTARAGEGLDEALYDKIEREVLPLIVGTDSEVRAGIAVLRLVRAALHPDTEEEGA